MMKPSEALEIVKELAEKHLEEHKPSIEDFVKIMIAMISVADTIYVFKKNSR